MNTLQVGNVLSIKPGRIYMIELRPKERVHQMIYLGEYDGDSEKYFVPVEIQYGTDSGSVKSMRFPVSIDVMKFLELERRGQGHYGHGHSQASYNEGENEVNENYRERREFMIGRKSELDFWREGENKVIRGQVLNTLEKIEIYERGFI